MQDLVNVRLPKIFQPYDCDLIRLGSQNDGGYLVCQDDIKESEVLLDLGISDDWTFEAAYSKTTGNGVLAFDGSITTKFWLKKICSALLHRTPKKIFDWYRQSQFFSGNNKLVHIFVGFSLKERNFISFREIFELFSNQLKGRSIYLKVDIESSEYRLLDDLIYFAPCMTGLAIEFHDVDLHLDKIERFINLFPMDVVHVHANNFGYPLKSGLPTVIEVTFSRNASTRTIPSLPRTLDAPNNPAAQDYKISFT